MAQVKIGTTCRVTPPVRAGTPRSGEKEPNDVILGSAPTLGVELEVRRHESGRTAQPARALDLPVHSAAQRALLRRGFDNPCTDRGQPQAGAVENDLAVLNEGGLTSHGDAGLVGHLGRPPGVVTL